MHRKNRNSLEVQLAQGLGWFSIGLGLAEMAAPAGLAGIAGFPARRKLLRLLGAREMISGLAVLSERRPTIPMWSRVVGDAMDLGLLASAWSSPRSDRRKLAGSIAMVAGVTAMDLYTSVQLSRKPHACRHALMVENTVTIDRPAAELYNFWRGFERLPKFMEHLDSVTQTGPNRWRWVAKGPARTKVIWDAEIVEEKPNELIAWRSLPESSVENSGCVTFERAGGGRGTVVRVRFAYHPPGGVLGAVVAKIFGEAPEKQVPVELRRFKQLMEVGEIVKTEGQPAGRSSSTSRLFDNFLRR